jgi:hypothetical protein
MPAMTMPANAALHGAHLLPDWLALVWVGVYVLIAAAHVGHMLSTGGQRRPWHASHVVMAMGMAFMYLPARIDPVSVPAGLWQAIFALAGLIAAGWAITGSGRVSTTLWLLTACDLGVMLDMWSGLGHPRETLVSWVLAGYLLAAALMWALDLYRRAERRPPIVDWRLFVIETAGGGAVAGVGSSTDSATTLLGERDISASMSLMTLGMAYMLVAMQFIG